MGCKHGRRLLPGGSHCLSRALALEVLMMRNGYRCKVCFGVHTAGIDRVAAHAWLEHEGGVLIGDDDLHQLIRLSPPADSAR